MKPSRDDAVSRLGMLRLLLLALGLILAVRVVYIQVFEHDKYKEIASRLWTKDQAVPAERGNLFDRHERPLALSVDRWQVGISRKRVTDPAELAAIVAPILNLDRRQLEKRIRQGSGHIVLAKNVVLNREQKLKLDSQPAVTADDMRSRIYPFGAVGASLVGFFRYGQESDIRTGLEMGLDSELAGTPGRARVIKRAGSHESLGQVILQQPVHGHSLVLTLDADLQTICERRLAEAIREKGAHGGSVLIIGPDSGDILAAASWPLMKSRDGRHDDPRVWENSNFIKTIEPGSVFKIFSAASLLRNAAIDTATVFDCDNDDFGRFRIRNDDGHKYGPLSLMQAFTKSSNIYFARASGNLTNEEFYRDLVDFGFGQKTTLPYQGQAAGILHNPTTWSGRSRPTIAIGQEVAATPLQLALAAGAVANGGILYAPRLVKEIRTRDGALIQEQDPVPLRRIMTEPLAEILRQAMERVVSQGTGQSAHCDWINCGGKTGTAQIPGEGGYLPGQYMASFMGMVPIQNPRLVILTILDRPSGYRQYYAAQSAAPLFRKVIHDIRQSTGWLDDAPGSRTAPMPQLEEMASIAVPDVLHLGADRAARRLARAGLKVTGNESGGVVVEQIPSAGSLVPGGQAVHLTLAGRNPGASAEGFICPDFSGLSNRQVRSLSARLGLALDLIGAGYAVSQSPAAGSPLLGKRITVRLEAPWH